MDWETIALFVLFGICVLGLITIFGLAAVVVVVDFMRGIRISSLKIKMGKPKIRGVSCLHCQVTSSEIDKELAGKVNSWWFRMKVKRAMLKRDMRVRPNDEYELSIWYFPIASQKLRSGQKRIELIITVHINGRRIYGVDSGTLRLEPNYCVT